LPVYEQWLKEWSLGAYRSGLETTVLKVLGATLLVLLTLGVVYVLWRTAHSIRAGVRFFRRPRGSEGQPHAGWAFRDPSGLAAVVVFSCLLAGYLSLPDVIHQPVYWWAVAQRLVTPLLLSTVLLVPSAIPGRWAIVLVVPALLVSTSYGIHLTNDFGSFFNGVEMRGLTRAVRSIPPGKKVLTLYDDREDHYTHYPLHFASCYYVVHRGGISTPFPRVPNYEKMAWVYPRQVLPAPPWGKLALFRYALHGRHHDYFLVKRHRDGRTRFHQFPARCMALVGHHGLWSVFRRVPGPGC
jgi:hypothetical protein